MFKKPWVLGSPFHVHTVDWIYGLRRDALDQMPLLWLGNRGYENVFVACKYRY